MTQQQLDNIESLCLYDALLLAFKAGKEYGVSPYIDAIQIHEDEDSVCATLERCCVNKENRMSFTDQKQFIATEDHVHARWSGGKDGKNFRCGLCGHKFTVGDRVRWVYMNSNPESHFGNFLTCEQCDGPDIVERRIKWEKEAKTRFWQLFKD